ncbi:neuraminidase-like domain-containing protein [Cohnella suwonensis]|uniref:Neuraminidase-like domain-containing protein n=1 Tax=Cohnella suwonensis TaxID=696072 RepID=A0ABW0M1B9_9BACL
MANEIKQSVNGVASLGANTLEGVRVQLYSRTLREEELIGEAVTDECGRYYIAYDLDSAKKNGRKTIDLFVRAEHPDKEVQPFVSKVVYRAKLREPINIPLYTADSTDTEWDRLESALAPILNGLDPAAISDEEAEYLSGTNGIPIHHVQNWIAASRLRQENGSLSASAYYGLLRGGMPNALERLAIMPAAEWEQALDNAVRYKQIPPIDERERNESLLRLAGTGESLRQKNALRREKGHAETAEEKEEVHPNLLLARSIAVQPDISPAWLTGSGERLSAIKADESTERSNDAFEERLRREKNMFPELNLDRAMEEARMTGQFRNPIRERLARFLEESADFDLGSTVVDKYVQSEKTGLTEEEGMTSALASRLKALQRVYQISPRYEHMSGLMEGGLDSALSVVSLSEEAFVDQYGSSLGGEEEAKQIYAQAEQVHATATHLYTSTYQAMYDVTPAALGGSMLSEQLRKELPDWAALFGRIDMCDCAECRSVYSAAAYYVDLLQYLNPKTLPGGMAERPIDVLRRHRPDLEHLQLTCENTNTVIPYIDLVNEVLESYIARGVPTVNNTAPDSLSEDLNVSREYSASFPEDISNDASTAVKQAVFPFSLPYDRPLQSTRAYLEHMGTSLHELVSTFPDNHPDYALAGDYLGLSSLDRNIWMGRLERGLWEFFGYPSDTVSEQGLLGSYYPNPNLTGSPVLIRVDPQLYFDWDEGSNVPTLPAKFSVRWTGWLVPKKTQPMKLSFDGTSGGYRFWFNGQLLFDYWGVTNPPVGQSQQIQMVAGQAYEIKLEYRCGGSTGEWVHLSWSENEFHSEHIPADQLRCNMPWSQHVGKIPEFLRRADITYDELLELLETRYINPNPAAPNVVIAAQSDPCDLETTWLQNLSFDNFAPLRDIHRFLRLRRKIGGTIRELDKTLSALGRERESFLVKLADLKRVHRELGESSVSLTELLALWNTLDTQGYDSLYLKLFQNKALMNPPDPDFGLLSGGKEIRGHLLPLASKRTQLLAVLRWKENDLQAVLEETGLSGANAMLTLANLSTLYRYSLLSRLLSLSVPECLVLLRLTDGTPFRSPSDTLKFIELRNVIEEAGFRIGELSYLFRNEELPNLPLDPTDTQIAKMAQILRDGFGRIESASAEDNGGSTVDALKRIFVIQTLAETLECTETAIAKLIENILRSSRSETPNAFAMDDFLSSQASVISASYRKLHKAAYIVRSLEIEPEEMVYFHDNRTEFQGLDFNQLPALEEPQGEEVRSLFRQWRLLTQYRYARDLLLPGGPGLLTLFREAKRQGATLESVTIQLSNLTGWDRADLLVLFGPEGWKLTPAHFVNPAKFPAIHTAVRLSERLRVPAVKWVSWTKDLPDAALAFEVKNAAKSRHSEQSWRLNAVGIENRLREQWREALVDCVLHYPAIKANGITNGNQLFEYFLIDVEMNADMKTSRIKQAISSVQLFVQRCLLNLEPGVPPKAIDAKQWEWLKNYRTWEANRKIFLYPENWVEPELRDDKTPIFVDLENEILQKEINDENVRQSFGYYLEQMDEFARLDIRALYRNGDEVHVFARTFSVPYVYYHRTKKLGKWTAWKKIDADIQGDHLIPFMFNASMYLFWAIMEKTADQKDNRPTSEQPGSSQERFVMKLGWTEYRNNRWTGKRVSDQGLFLQWLYPTDDLEQSKLNYFLTPKLLSDGQNLAFDVHRDFRAISTFKYTAETYGRFFFNDTRKSTTILPRLGIERIEGYAPQDTDMSGMFLGGAEDMVFSILHVKGENGIYDPVRIMDQAQGPFRLLAPLDLWGNFAFYDNRKALVYVHQDYYRTYYVEQSGNLHSPGVRYESLFHPLSRSFVRACNEGGVEGLLSLGTQRMTNETQYPPIFTRTYEPTSSVHGTPPLENVDFSYQGAYGIYNWELFFHVPMLLADRLTKERRYEEAMKWYHYVFNPTIDSDEPSPRRYWRFLPFNENTEENRIWKLLTILADPNGDPNVKQELQNQIAEWRSNPFEPHRIARMRISSYQKSVVMKYIDTLIAWGDDLFARDTMESINEATQLYVMAANLLGPRPEHIPELTKSAAKSYAQLRQAGLDDFSNALVDVQNRFPYIKVQPAVGSNGSPIGSGVGRSLYFGIPKNDKLLRYWDTVEDRLMKIRSGLNLEGIARKLSLFETPIDPASAIRSTSAGAGAGSVLADLSQPLGYYRFAAVLPKALELCGEAKALGAALLSALEKKDAEELGSLRARHETSLHRLIRQVKTNQIEEAKKALEGLQKSRSVVEYRHNHYKTLGAGNMNLFETAQLIGMGGSVLLQGIAEVSALTSTAGHAAPDMTVGVEGWASTPVATTHFGGSNVGRASDSFGRAMNTLASILGTTASMSGIVGGYKRRSEEWKLQEESASKELAQIDAQIAGAEIRLSTAERELFNQDKQIEHAEEVERFLREKFTNRELYQWMATQLTTLFFQTYQLAYNTAKRAEMAYRFERGITDSGFIKFGWDSLKKGLLAGERLHLDLKRLEMAYHDQNSRDYELTKSVSLVQLDPIALIALKETGACTIAMPEELFDMDHPGQYMRRIKSVNVSIPCVTGPHTGVQGRLTLMSSRIRANNSASDPYKRQPDDPRFLHDFSAVQSIAFSHAQNDAGLFELSFRDERYLPFEGAGAVSEWRLELPRETNAFDFDSISDIILRISYTAREGGDELRTAAFASAVLDEAAEQGASGSPVRKLPAQPNLQRLFSVRHEFSSEWHRFLHPGPSETAQSLPLKLEAVRFPYRYRGRELTVHRVKGYLKLKEGTAYPGNGSPLLLTLITPNAGSEMSAPLLSNDSVLHGMPIAEYEVSAQGKGFGEWMLKASEAAIAALPAALKVTVDGHTRLNGGVIEDLLVLCDYSID